MRKELLGILTLICHIEDKRDREKAFSNLHNELVWLVEQRLREDSEKVKLIKS